jgi:hypothetical protein
LSGMRSPYAEMRSPRRSASTSSICFASFALLAKP